MKTIIAPGLRARLLGLSGWFSTNILGNRDGEVLDDPGSFKTKEESKLSVLDTILQPELNPDLYGNIFHKVRINYYPPRGDQGGRAASTSSAVRPAHAIKIDFLCDSILAAPVVSICCSSWISPPAPASRASRSGCPSISSPPWPARTCAPSTTSSSST
jgi:myo-inositol-1-phosphate synthase